MGASISALCCSTSYVSDALAPIHRSGWHKPKASDSRRPYSAASAQQHDYPVLDSNLLQEQMITKHLDRRRSEPRSRPLNEVDDIRLIRGARRAEDVQAALRSISARFWRAGPEEPFRALPHLDFLNMDVNVYIESPPLSLATPQHRDPLIDTTADFQFFSTRLLAAALRSVAHIQRNGSSRRGADGPSSRALQDQLIRALEDRLFDQSPAADLHALSDILDGLGIFVARDASMLELAQPLAYRAVHLMIRNHTEFDIGRLTPTKLSLIVQNIEQMELDNTDSSEMLRTAVLRITKKDALDRTTPTTLSHSLSAVTSIASTSSMNAEAFGDFLPHFLKAATGRFAVPKPH